ncbi:MAG: SRPBCC family protein [Alphaproteobacteria bacterium]|nr:SRPBCC family protein [Alphaproteobacteria bacterium]
MLKKIVVGTAALAGFVVAGVLAFAATQPDTFRVERTASIKAPPEKIFALVNDLHQHRLWSPWEKKDPDMKRSYSGAASGKGAVYEWDGNKEIGKGRMAIAETKPPTQVVFALDFLQPFEAHNIAGFDLRPKGDATDVTWSIHGPMPFLSKVMCVFFDMDKMIGREFETGLANLKAVTER